MKSYYEQRHSPFRVISGNDYPICKHCGSDVGVAWDTHDSEVFVPYWQADEDGELVYCDECWEEVTKEVE